jgi:hypothetical protein
MTRTSSSYRPQHISAVIAGLCVLGLSTAGLIYTFGKPHHEKEVVQAPPAATTPAETPEAAQIDVRIALAGRDDAAVNQVYGAFDYKPLWSGGRHGRARAERLSRAIKDFDKHAIDTTALAAALTAARDNDGKDARLDVAVTRELL